MVSLILFSLLLSALFSGSEIAFISANKIKVELKKKKGSRRSSILANFYDKPADFLGTMLVGNNIALVVFTTLMAQLLTPPLNKFITGEPTLLLINTLLITVIVLIFGEFMPKTFFRLFADDALYLLAYPLKGLQWLLKIPSWVVIQLSNWMLRLLFKTEEETAESAFTRLDLENFVKDSQAPDAEEIIDTELFGKALNLKELRARDIMIPRTEIESIDVDASVKDLEDQIRETKLSRIIVTKDDIDNVLGYVHHQQLLKEPKSIKHLIMDIEFIPETMRVTDLLDKFIKERINIACVVDEFGGLAGLVTLEDILEELFGEIEDEHDQEEYVEHQVGPNEFIFSGRLEIDYLNGKYETLEFPEGEYNTLSGYLVMTTETIPEQGAEIVMDGYKFILELVSDTKIETIRVLIMEKDEQSPPSQK